MKAYLRSVIVIMAVSSTTALAEPDDFIPMVSDIEMKAQQQEAMAQIELQIKRQLTVNLAKHYQMLSQQPQYDKHAISETVKNHSDNMEIHPHKDGYKNHYTRR